MKKLNLIQNILYFYLVIISVCLFCVYLYMLYIISLNLLVYILLLIFVFSCLILYYKKNFNKLSNKYLKILINVNYTFLIQRIVLIKFLFLYFYLASDTVYCGSAFTELLHDTFIGIGQNLGVKPKTTVSTLETIGMCTIIVGTVYCSIKGYQLITHTSPKSINTKLDEMDAKLTNLESNLRIQIEESRVNLIETQGSFSKLAIKNFKEVGQGLDFTNFNIVDLEEKVDTLNSTIINNQNTFNTLIREELQKNVAEIERICKIQHEYLERNSNGFSQEDIIELNRLKIEIDSLINSNNTILENLPVQNSIVSITKKSSNNNYVSDRAQEAEMINNTIVEHFKNIGISTQIKTLKKNNSVSEIKPEVNEISDIHNYKLTEFTTAKIVLTNIASEAQNIVLSTANHVAKRVFHGITVDVLAKVLIDSLSNMLNGSLTANAFFSLLKILGLYSTSSIHSTPSTSETVGRTISKILRDFIHGFKNVK